MEDAQIAVVFDIRLETLRRWIARHSAFRDAFQRGRALADSAVAAAMYRSAVGFTVMEQEWKTEHGELRLVEHQKEFVPNVNAGIFILKNRHPELWGDRPGNIVEDTRRVSVDDVDLSTFSDEELEVLGRVGHSLREKATEAVQGRSSGELVPLEENTEPVPMKRKGRVSVEMKRRVTRA
jgi:hypothetical protein